MAKIKLTKGELKRQRDTLIRYGRYLPTLQLKKQQLQMEILRQLTILDQRQALEASKRREIASWAGLIAEGGAEIKSYIAPSAVITGVKNIAGVDMPVFEKAEYPGCEYDLFAAPLWMDAGIDALRGLFSLRKEIRIIEEGLNILRRELRITAQRVNLFEKVKIPEAEEAIRVIKIYIGDQMANAVGRSKIAKRRLEEITLA